MEIICDYENKEYFSFNYDRVFKYNFVILEDKITHKRYKINLPGNSNEIYYWMNIIDQSKGYSFYRIDGRIVLVVIPDKKLDYIFHDSEKKLYISKIIKHNREDLNEYYLSNIYCTKCEEKVFEIYCDEYIEYNAETVNIENISNIFELKSMIYFLREKYCK